MKGTLRFIISILALTTIVGLPKAVYAQDATSSGEAAQLVHFGDIAGSHFHDLKEPIVDLRPLFLKNFLHDQGSPLEEEAETFIKEADRNKLDWKLVAAISGVESTFGKNIPNGSYNAWGWGIPTGTQSGICFKDWKDGIASVSEGIKKNYVDKGATNLNSIGAIYAASPAWAGHVQYFIDKINAVTPANSPQLALSI